MSHADRDYVENALNPADDPFQDECESTNPGVFTMLTHPLEVRTPRGATKIAPPQAISGMIPRFQIDHYLM